MSVIKINIACLSLLLTSSFADAATSYNPDGGGYCASHPCTITVTAAGSTATSGEVTELNTAIETTAQCGDTVQIEGGVLWPIDGSADRIDIYQQCSSSNPLTIQTDKIAQLPDENTRITPAYKNLLPVLRIENTFDWPHVIYVAGKDGAPARGIRMIGLSVDTNYDHTNSLVQLGGRPSAPGAANGFDDQPSDIVLDRFYADIPSNMQNQIGQFLWASCYGTGILDGCTLKNSWINVVGTTLGSYESKVVLVGNADGLRNFNAINNWLSGGTETIMNGGFGNHWKNGRSRGELAYNSMLKIWHQSRTFNWTAGERVFKGRQVHATHTTTNPPFSTTGQNIFATAMNSGTTGSSEPSWAPGTINDNGISWWVHAPAVYQMHYNKNIYEIKNASDIDMHHNTFGPQWRGDDYHYYAIVFKLTNCKEGGSSTCDCTPYATGTATVSGTSVTWASGDPLPNSWRPGTYNITLNGVGYTIADFETENNNHLTLTSSAGSGTKTFVYGTSYSGPTYCLASYDSNVDFRRNVVRHSDSAIVMAAFEKPDTRNTRNIRIFDNLFWDIDRVKWKGYNGTGSLDHSSLVIAYNPPRTQIVHNTGLTHPTNMLRGFTGYGVASDIYGDTIFKNNMFNKGTQGGFDMQQTAEGDPSINLDICGGGSGCTDDSQYDENLFAGVNLGNYSIGDTYNLCPSSSACSVNWDYKDPTYGKLFQNFNAGAVRTGGVISVRPEHWAAKSGTDGLDLGLTQWNELPIIRNFHVVPTDTQALMTWELSPAIAHIPCVVEVATDDELINIVSDINPATYTRPDSDRRNDFVVAGLRRMFIAGANSPLSPSTKYYYRLQCGGDSLYELDDGTFANFTTLAALSSTKTIETTFTPKTSANYRVDWGTYSRSANTITGNQTSWQPCTAGQPCQISWTPNRGDIPVWGIEQESVGLAKEPAAIAIQ